MSAVSNGEITKVLGKRPLDTTEKKQVTFSEEPPKVRVEKTALSILAAELQKEGYQHPEKYAQVTLWDTGNFLVSPDVRREISKAKNPDAMRDTLIAHANMLLEQEVYQVDREYQRLLPSGLHPQEALKLASLKVENMAQQTAYRTKNLTTFEFVEQVVTPASTLRGRQKDAGRENSCNIALIRHHSKPPVFELKDKGPGTSPYFPTAASGG